MSKPLLSFPLIRDLVAFPTVSRDPNRELLRYVEDHLARHGVRAEIFWDEDRRKGSLWATIGPADRRGVILSGHSDVVPVDGQDWTSDPFTLRAEGERLYGRGTADMKGFIAAALALVPEMVRRPLKAPVHVAISYDEEVGCLGVRGLVRRVASLDPRPGLCLVGEPTSMRVVVGHKGGRSYRIKVRGRAAHSSLAPRAVNAIEHAAELVMFLRGIAREWAEHGPFDDEYDLPHSTLSTALIEGGTAINIVPEACELVFEFRHLAAVDAEAVTRRIVAFAQDELAPRMRALAPEAGLAFSELYEYPGLDVVPEHPAATFVKRLAGRNDHGKVAFGTEAGLFRERAGVAAVVCGPGSIEQAHKPDEYVAVEQIEQCERFLRRLLARLEEGELGFPA
jgi:acetylornithine deacetylase